MKNTTFASFTDQLEQAGRALARAARYGAAAVVGMSWPALLATCVGLALAITIAPLVLFLFVVFLAARLLARSTLAGQRGPAHLPPSGKGK